MKKINIHAAAKRYKATLDRLLKRAGAGKSLIEEDYWVCLGDVADHIKLCNFILRRKNPDKSDVYRMICDLDTASGEQLPKAFTDWTDDE